MSGIMTKPEGSHESGKTCASWVPVRQPAITVEEPGHCVYRFAAYLVLGDQQLHRVSRKTFVCSRVAWRYTWLGACLG